jgi:hypothetical protein
VEHVLVGGELGEGIGAGRRESGSILERGHAPIIASDDLASKRAS